MTVSEIYQCYLSCRTISTDTRKINPDSMFFALKGANFNGNLFAAEALQKGAKYVVIDEKEILPTTHKEKYILVDNVLETLQQVATYRRKQFNIPFIAIVGSNGKTTTKELLKEVLAQKYRVYATEGNLNNHIGVPITLLTMPADTEIAVIEMGANRLGDNAELCQFAAPTHGIATNVGQDHLEGFGNIENVFRSQTELYDYLIKTNGMIIVNSTDDLLAHAAKRRCKAENISWYGTKGDFSYLKLVTLNPFVVYENEENKPIQTQLIGEYNLPNMMVAAAFGKLFGVEVAKIDAAIAHYKPSNNRSQWIETPNYKIISDAYNANPSSMKVALSNLAAINTTNTNNTSHIKNNYKTAILGDMFEMGEESLDKHREIMAFAQTLEIDKLIFCGKDFQAVYEPHEKSLCFENKTALQTWLATHTLPHGYLLLKASRGIGLETLLASLQ
jgi:UDP-N-acetylmuramoyl-tripeptide--D-alanyl-D-alanine ligase